LLLLAEEHNENEKGVFLGDLDKELLFGILITGMLALYRCGIFYFYLLIVEF
jgi:hypothetical protein